MYSEPCLGMGLDEFIPASARWIRQKLGRAMRCVCYTVFYYIQATCSQMMMMVFYCYIGKRPQLEGKTENGGICAKKRIRVRAVVLMARPLPAKEIAQK